VTIPGGATRTITGAGIVTYTGLPTGAVCTVTEPDQGFASSHTVAPANLTIGNGTTVAATVTNVFPNGSLALTKVVSGPGASQAPATFGATVTCLWHGAPVPLAAGGRVTLRPGTTTTVANIPVDAVCSIVEDDAGQDDTIYTPATAVIVPTGSPTATIQTENVYLLASLRVAKNVEPNEGAVPSGFGMSVECSFRGATVLPLTNFALDGGEFRDFTGLPSR
jgi:large repetitive protein